MKKIKKIVKWLLPGFLSDRERELRFMAKSAGMLFPCYFAVLIALEDETPFKEQWHFEWFRNILEVTGRPLFQAVETLGLHENFILPFPFMPAAALRMMWYLAKTFGRWTRDGFRKGQRAGDQAANPSSLPTENIQSGKL